jgi:ribose transport system substrate-binding protein
MSNDAHPCTTTKSYRRDMSNHTRKISLVAGAAVSAAALMLTGCSGGGSTPVSSDGGDAPAGADLAAAKAYLEPYQADTKSLVLDEPLAAPLPEGLNIAFLDVGTPVAGVMWDLIQPIVEITGIKLTREPIGATPEAQDAAMASVYEKGYDGIINVTAEPQFYPNQAEKLVEAGVPIASASVMHTDDYGFPTGFNGPDFMEEVGRAQAAAAIVRTNGEATEFVFYPVNEFEFTGFQRDGFVEKMAELCPDCTVRDVGIPIDEVIAIDNSRIVSDLEAHPETQYYVASADEITVGMPERLDLAGVTTKGYGTWSIPPNLDQVAAGLADATFAEDFSLFMWTVVDQLFREITGTPYEWPAPEVSAPAVMKLLDQGLAEEYVPTHGYLAVPDYQEQYAENWGF